MTTEISREILVKRVEELEKTNLELETLVGYYRGLAEGDQPKDASREYKDRLFKFIFGNPDCKQWTLSLYNAMNGSNYTNPEEIRFNTLGNVVYMRMRNDVSFLVSSVMNLWEHQSTFNPNMPMRFLIYAGSLYDKYIQESTYYKYSSRIQPVPTPRCVCFYNGRQEQSEKTVLKLSQAYEGEGDIEVVVTMLNINYGKNQELMDACEPLKEYAWLVDRTRFYQDTHVGLEEAVSLAIDEMPDEFLLKGFLMAHRAEVKGMFLTEYDEEKTLRQEREEGREDGREERTLEIVRNMLKEGIGPVSLISRISNLPEDEIRKLAAALGIVI